MKRATALPTYRDLSDFQAPEGVTTVDIDPTSMQLATPSCPVMRREVFITGTEPTEFCELHGGRMMTQTPPASWLSRLFGGGAAKTEDSAPADASSTAPKPAGSAPAAKEAPSKPVAKAAPSSAPPAPPTTESKKPGVLDRIFGIFGGK